LSPNPILKVLSTFRKCEVRALLMGGQACILYGAAEFTRYTDFAVLCSEENLDRLREALERLAAEPVFLPPLETAYLERGHACHFRCGAPEVSGFRIDIMARMRGCDPFPELWKRREIMELPDAGDIAVLSLPDLVRSKKTQRDKDWPMIRRLIEADYERRREEAAEENVRFWLRESRTPAMLIELVRAFPRIATEVERMRPLLTLARAASEERLETALMEEEMRERREDRAYWKPLREELERMRHGLRSE